MCWPAFDSFGDFDIQASMLNLYLTLCIHFRGAEGNISRRTVKTVFQINIDFCMTVLPTRMEAKLLPVGSMEACTAKQLFKKITKGSGVTTGKTAASKFETFIPVWRRPEILSGFPMGA